MQLYYTYLMAYQKLLKHKAAISYYVQYIVHRVMNVLYGVRSQLIFKLRCYDSQHCVYVCMHMYLHALVMYMCVCMHMYLHALVMYMCVSACTCYVHMCMHAHASACTCVCVHAHVSTCTCVCMHMCFVCRYVCTHVFVHNYVDTC